MRVIRCLCFFKQKTAYEMRISDWSSDVCSSDLPIAATLAADPRALFRFSGPHGYVSPESLTDRDWAPTWNFAVVRIEADVAFDDALTDRALRRLVTKMEAGRRPPWSVEEMGDRYPAMRAKVIGFRAVIRANTPRFKLGQDERPAVFAEIVASLPEPALVRWMRRRSEDNKSEL